MLTDGIITLRAPEPSDLDAMYRWENDTRFWEGGDTCAPLSHHLLDGFISNYDGNIAATHQLRLVITTCGNGEAVGTVDLFEYSPIHLRAGIGILIDGNFRRQGLGLRALRLTANYCRTHLGLHQLWCHIAADNIASRQLFEKAGFTASGRLRSWLRRGNSFADIHIYQLSLSTVCPPPRHTERNDIGEDTSARQCQMNLALRSTYSYLCTNFVNKANEI